ncbi:hypothetical protein PV08_10656 [Exophiala spinifera]|uniref:FAD-binding domain-containing protein n=1 Tax=Exophiala spinifera TaxID=91928 RepID=A0A0D1Y8N5_9EURO|nr:uncharacterized protein PV08_10656 [Exophiala spinifera]KIW11356.1 hypothetical protein PV08_10656 [Exophiala spinifera]
MPHLKIAIIGAGPAGCLLAPYLIQGSIEVTIFEAEDSPTARSQGGTLDLHPNTGISAIEEAGLGVALSKLLRCGGSRLKVVDQRLQTYFYLPSALHNAPEIDREQLRTMLLASIPDQVIRWSHKLKEIPSPGVLTFDNGQSEADYNLIVGADGAWSQVRRALSNQLPVYSGVSGYDLNIPDAVNISPASSDLVGGGTIFAFANGKSIIGQQLGSGSISVSVWSRQGDGWMTDRREQSPLPADILDGYNDWAPELQTLVVDAIGPIRISALYMLPLGFRWDHKPGITLVGDAAHLCTPFGGEGVNLALRDAQKLGRAIIEASRDRDLVTNLDKRVAVYEADLFKTGHKAQVMAYDMMRAMYFTNGAPRAGIESWVIARAVYNTPQILVGVHHLLLAVGVYSLFFFIKLFI